MQESMRVISGGNTGNAARLWHTPLRTRAAVRPALRQGAALAVGLAGGWAVLYGRCSPLGPVGFGSGEDCFAASAAGAALGLLLHGFGALSLQSICLLCGLGAIVAGRWLWPGRFLPAAAAGGAALACSAFCLSLGAEGGGVELLLFCGADALLAGAIGFGLRRFPPEKPGAGTLLPAMACAAALGSLALGPLVLGVAACAAAEYLLCCQGKGRAALALCAATGAALCAVDPELAPAAAGLSCATGAAALLAPGRRVEALAAYAGGCVTGALCVQPPGNAFSALLSAGAGLGVVCFLPRQWLTPAGPEEPPGETPQEERPRLRWRPPGWKPWPRAFPRWLRRSTRYTTRSPRRCENFRWVIDNTHDTLCANCGRRESCWKQEYAATLEGMEALRPVLEQQGHLEPSDLPGQLSRCIHPAALCATATRSFALYRSRKEAHVHAEALRTALTEQYSAVADALGVLSEQLGRPGTPEPYKSGRVASFLLPWGPRRWNAPSRWTIWAGPGRR